MPNYEFYSEGFSSVEARDKLYFKIALKNKIAKLEADIKLAENSIKKETDNDIAGLKIYDIQDLYKKVEKTKMFLNLFLENEQKPEIEQKPLEWFIWEYNDGKFRTREERYFASDDYKEYSKKRGNSIIWIIIGTILIVPMIAMGTHPFDEGFLLWIIMCLPVSGFLGIIFALIWGALSKRSKEVELREHGLDIDKLPVDSADIGLGIGATKMTYDTIKSIKDSELL